MAADVAEFLWSKFLSSLEEAESELSGSISISNFKSIKKLISKFLAIKNVVKDLDIMPQPYYSYSETIRLLYDLNDALADFRIFAHECKELNQQLLIFNPLTFYFVRRMKKRLTAIETELSSLAAQRNEDNGYGGHHSAERSQPIPPSRVFGFDEQVKKIEDLLFGGGDGFTPIGVVGIAGAGKTTLVQKLVESKRVKDAFSPIIWLPISGTREQGEEQQCSMFRFETCILDHSGRTLDGRIVGLGKLLERLNQLLLGNKYLIVLDDVQHRHINIGDRLWRGLPKGSGGAAIVTSRLLDVAEMLVEKDNVIHIKPLDGEACWSIFQETIKINREIINMSHEQTLEKIKKEIKDQCQGLPLAAKVLAEIIPEQIREIQSKRFLKEMYIPDELLKADLDVEPAVNKPNSPVLVFIDIRNEQLGESLYNEFCYYLNKKQVFVVLEEISNSKIKVKPQNPETVLKDVYGTLQKLKSKGYTFAFDIEKRMRIIIVGGDSVANWILGILCDLKLPEPPSIVPIPQETNSTENNIPVSFGWTKLNAGRQSVRSFLASVTYSQQIKTDSWHILITMKGSQSSTTHHEIPHSLHLFGPVQEGGTQNADYLKLFGGFWSYFSLGVDAPRWNWHLNARTLKSFAEVKVQKHGQWGLLTVPSGIRSFLCLNLPTEKDRKNLTVPFIDDGSLEIFGLKDGLLHQNEHIFLDQVQGIRFEFIKGVAECVNMSIDGAQWKQIPLSGIIDVQISCHSQVNFLANGDCPAKRSIRDSLQPHASRTDDNNNAKDSSTDGIDNVKDNSRAHMKFGPTNTFKIP